MRIILILLAALFIAGCGVQITTDIEKPIENQRFVREYTQTNGGIEEFKIIRDTQTNIRYLIWIYNSKGAITKLEEIR